jgi:ATP-dependent Clp protease ATP-binding subunit ClpA
MDTMHPRPYLSKDHLATRLESERGKIWLTPQEADRIYFDIASANSMPANQPISTYNGSTVLDIGGGVLIRASGSVFRMPEGWVVDSSWWPKQYPSCRELTPRQDQRARTVVSELIGGWAATHEGDIQQADDIERNNAARRLEEQIIKHEAALTRLRNELRACENGLTYTQFPDLPTKGR